MSRTNTHLGYNERQRNLSIRIEAYKRFSNFDLEDWLDKRLTFKPGDIILDIGCGNGNYFPCYSRKLGDRGAIVGIDQSKELLSEAIKLEGTTPKVLLEWNMNNRFPFIERSFNHVISTFAIYYVDDARAIVEDIKRVLKTSGEVFLIGPTNNNARELYEFNKNIFNFGIDEKGSRRTNRIEKEFYPVIRDIFKSVSAGKIQSKLVFPSRVEFIEYYMATLLFEESVKKSRFKPDANKLLSFNIPSLEICKEMIMLRGRKNE